MSPDEPDVIATFLAHLPDRASALSWRAGGEGCKLVLEIPMTEAGKVADLPLRLASKVVRVVILDETP